MNFSRGIVNLTFGFPKEDKTKLWPVLYFSGANVKCKCRHITQSQTPMSDKLFFDSIRYRYDIRASEKTFFLRNFRRIFRNFGEFSEFSENFLNFWRIFGIFGEFSDFRRIFGGKTQNKSISRYSILEVRYDICFDMLKSPIYRHSIISRYDKPIPGPGPAPLPWDESRSIYFSVGGQMINE